MSEKLQEQASCLLFTVPGVAQPKQRARTVRLRNGRSVTYTPEETTNFEAKVSHYAWKAIHPASSFFPIKFPLQGPVGLFIEVVRPWPKSMSQKARAAGAWPTTRPDTGNIQKAIEDALIGIIYADDAQIVHGVVRKRYGDDALVHILVGSYPWSKAEVYIDGESVVEDEDYSMMCAMAGIASVIWK